MDFKRLAESRFANWQGSLLLDAGEQKVTLGVAGGRITLTSDTAVPKVLRGRLIQPLARVLFPNLFPMLIHWDEC